MPERELAEAQGTIEALEGEARHHARRADVAMADFLRVKRELDVCEATLIEIAEWHEVDFNGEYKKWMPLSGPEASSRAWLALKDIGRDVNVVRHGRQRVALNQHLSSEEADR